MAADEENPFIEFIRTRAFKDRRGIDLTPSASGSVQCVHYGLGTV